MNQKTKKWVPKKGEIFYFFTVAGIIKRKRYNYPLHDKQYIAMGNVFQTREEAEHAFKLLKKHINFVLKQ